MVILQTAQGCRGAPLTWAAVASLLNRCSQSLFVTPSAQKACLQTYVDDPILGLQGTSAERRRMAVKLITFFLIMGIGLAFHKAQLPSKVVWVGVELEATPWEIIASIPQEKLTDHDTIIQEMLNANIVSIKALRSLAGKGTNVATLLYMWRPFLNHVWAFPRMTHTVQTLQLSVFGQNRLFHRCRGFSRLLGARKVPSAAPSHITVVSVSQPQ